MNSMHVKNAVIAILGNKITYSLLIFLSFFHTTFSQVTISGGSNVNGPYPTVAAAVSALNGATISGPVLVSVVAGHTETVPAGGIELTATGTVVNTITFFKSGMGANPLLTAYVNGAGTPGTAVQDGIFRLVGSDYVTIDGINLTENPLNTTNPSTMEYGFGLFKQSVSNGCQFNTIKNCVITLSYINNASGTLPAVEGSRGIDVLNSTPTATTTSLVPTLSSGTNSNNKFYSNTISNCNYGIVLSGYAASSPFNLGDTLNDVGGNSAMTGNTIFNYGGAPGATNPSSAIRAINQWGVNISFNTINNNNGTHFNHVTTFRGIYAQSGTSASANINNNNITLKGGATTSQLAFIENGIGSTPAGNTVNINNNILTGNYLTATSGACYGIYNNAATPAILNILGNTVQNLDYSDLTLLGSGTLYCIYNTSSIANMAVNIINNTVKNIKRFGTSGGTTIGVFNSSGVTGMAVTVKKNLVDSMSIDGAGTASTMYGIQTVLGTIVVDSNTISNLRCLKTTGSSALYGIYNISTPVNENYNFNNIFNIVHSGTGTTYGLYAFTATGVRTVSFNTISNISSLGTTVGGINQSSSAPTIFNNKIYDIISYSTGAPLVFGIQITSTGTANNANVYNNLIGNLKAPLANTSAATSPTLRGINLTTTSTTTTVNVSYNTIYLDAQSTGANFGTCGLFATTSTTATTATLNLNNNNIVNLSNPKGIGKTTAYQRSSTTLTNYGSGSNRNNFYAGGTCVNRLIFFDGTNADSVLADFKTRVSTREANSVSESPNFLSTAGSNANFLHIDPAKPTLLESGGAAVAGITTDFDGNTRNATTPDIGADEFTGTVATACSGQPVAGTITANPNPLCSNGITTICVSGQSTGSGLTYQWKSSNAPGGPFTNISCAKDKCFTTDPLVTGTYYYKLIVTCPASGMSDSTSVISVIVNTNPVANVSPVNPFICEGGSTTLTASGGVNYLWSTGATTPSINVNPPSATNYTVTVTDAVGCTASASSKVTVINKPVITSVSAIPPSICKGENSQLNVEVDTNYFFIPVNYNLIDSTGSNAIKLVTAGVAVTPLTSGSLDDGYWSPISLPFQFNFYGISYSSLTISTNGNIHFETATASGYNNTMPNTLTPNATIAGVFSDLNMGTNVSTDVWYFIKGSAPNRQFVLIVDTTNFFSGTGQCSYQIIIKEGSNEIEIHTGLMTQTTSNKVQGIENATGTLGLVIPGRNNTPLWSGIPDAYKFSRGLNYVWSPTNYLNNNLIKNPLASNVQTSTFYNVTVTASNGCSSSGFTSLIVNPNANISETDNSGNAPNDSTICAGDLAVITATGGTMYSWSNGATTGTINVNPIVTTNYIVTVTDAGGCSDVLSRKITVTQKPVIGITYMESSGNTPNDSIICNGASVMITASGGTGYQWSNGGNSAKITVNPSITTPYTVTVTDANNCSSTRTTQIVVNPLPNAAIAPLNPSNCSGKNITLTASGGTSYFWSNGGSGNMITVAPTMNTTYTVTVTDANGCSSTASSTVNVLPNPGLSENHVEPTTCVSTDGSINLTVSPTGSYTFSWIGPNGYTNNIEDITGLVAGGYSVTVTSSGNGCSSVLAVTLNGPGGCNVCPAIGILTTTPANEACDGMNVNLLASGLSNMGNTYGITFKRSNVVLADPYSGGTIIATIPNASLGGGGTTATTNHIFPGTGTYYLYAILSPVPTDISCRPSASRTLVINPTPVVNITPAVVITCQGQPVNMNGNPSGGTGAYTHLWTGTGAVFLNNTGIVNPIFNCPTPGTYTLTYRVTDSKGCSASATRSVTVTNCTLSIKDPCSCLNNATTLTNGQFSELVQVNAPSGQSWSVSAVSGLFLNSSPPPPAAPLAIPIGTTLTVGTADGIDNDNDGQFDEADENVYYTLRGKHVDAIGYTVSVTNSLGVTLSIGNTCYYPNPQINGLNANYCITDPAVVLNGSATLGDGSGPASGVGVFRVNGVVNTVFNPASVGLGNHTVQYCFDAADNVPNNRHPGCTQCVSQAVTVNGPPTISCPAPLTVGCAIDVPAPNPASVVVTSNPCASPATVTHVSDVISNQTCANRYVVTRTYRAVNSCCPGSAVTCTQIITVNDITAPSVVCPPPVTVQCASAVPPVNVASVITADHCGNVGLVVTHVGDVVSNLTCVNRFTVNRTYRSTDVCGNSGTCSQVITVFDNTAPVVVCRNVTIFLDANGNATVTPQQLLSSVSDNCTATPAIVITAVPSTFTCANIGPNNVNLRATDECGNVGTCLAVVTVVDNLPPVIMGCPTKSPVTINLGPGECEASWDAPPFMAMDNCPAGAYFGNRNTTTVCLPPASYWSITGGAASWGVMFDLVNTSGSLLNLQLLGERAFANVPHNIYYTTNPGGHAPVVATPNAWTLCATRTPTSGAQFTTVIDSFRLLTGTRTDTIKRCAPIQTETTVLGCLTMAPGETRGIYIHAPGTGGTNASLFSGCAARPMGDANIRTPLDGATYTGGQFAAPFINSSFGFGGANWMGVIGYNLANSNRVPLVQTCGAPYGPGCFFPIGCTKLCYRATDASGNVGTCEFEVCVNKYANPTRALACNDDIQISLDDSCRATIYPDMVLEGGPYSCYDDYIVEVRDWKGGPLIDREPNRRGVQINGNDIGRELKITIIDPVTGNSCWGHGRVEDKIAPKMTCPPDISLSCASSTAPIVAGLPSVYENCGGANIGYHDSEVQGGCPQGYARRITRTWTATDASGNKSVCVQTITVKIGDLFEVTVPSNYDNLDQPALECDEKIDRNKNVTPHMADFPECVDGYILDSAFWLANPNAPDQYPNRRLPRVLGWNCIDDLNDPHYGHPSPDPVYYPQHRQWSPNNPLCWGPDRHIMWVGTGRPGGAECSNLTVTYKDIVFDLATPGCDAGPIGCYKVLRQWTVMDWCTSQLGGHNQIIKVIDDEGPQVLYPDSARVNMESWTCTGRWEVPAPWILDNCSNEVHYTVEVDNGTVLGDETAGFVVLDMPEGIYNGYIVATDCCGNITKKRIVLNVIDRVPPQAVCRTATVVSLSGNQSPLTNYARLHAEDLDEGSFDNCQPHVYFKVIRMAELLGTNNGSNSNNVVACQGRNGDDNSILAGNQIYFDDYTDFCCADVGTKVMVVLRVFDVDPGAGPVTPIRMTSTSSVLNGRFSDCMVEVEVQNKAVPTVIAPPNIVVSCWFWFDVTKLTNPNDATFGKVVTSLTDRRKVVTKDLVCYKFCERNDYTGYPGYVQTNAQPKPAPNQACEYYYQYFDTAHWDRKYELVWGFDGYVLSPCGSTPTITVNDLRECGQGVIQRIISTTGPNNINVTAIQTIWVVDCDPFYIDDVACNDPRYTDLLWPNGVCTQTPVTLDGCGADISPDNPQLGRPQVINNADDNCALLSIEYFDEQFNIEPDACFKVLRRWVVIDWCQYDPFIDPNHGRWEALQVIKVRDQNRPVVSCSVGPCEPAKIDSKLGVCVGHISLTASATDNCTPADWLFWEYKIDAFNDGKGVHGGYDFRVGTLTSKQYAAGDTVEYSHNPFADDSHNPFNASGTYPIGIHKIKWFVEDGCGNVGVCESLFEIKDCKAPTPYCLTGVITVPMPSSGCVDIWAKDLDKGSYDNCTSQENLKFYFDEDPTKPSLSICCQDFIDKKVNDELILEVELWVEDEEGNKDYCKTIIVVQDNQDICPDIGSAKGKISGNIKTETGVETRPVEVSLFHNGSMMRQMMGSPYSFGDLVMNTTYSVKPERNDDHANGVTTQDIVKIQKHILGQAEITDPYKLLAADVNASKTITASDMAELRKLILGINSEFRNVKSWTFVPADYVFADPKSPWDAPRSADLMLDKSRVIDFISVKMGDVTGDSRANGSQGIQSRTNGKLSFEIKDQEVIAGESYRVSFKSSDFRNISGYQFTLKFDENSLIYEGIESGVLKTAEANFGTKRISEGMLTTSWNADKGISYGKEEELFVVNFRATRNGKLSNLLTINSNLTSAQAYDEKENVLEPVMFVRTDKGIVESGVFELYQNEPNPFSKETVVSYRLPESGAVKLTVYDVTGKVLRVYEMRGQKGLNHHQISKGDLNATGVLYYQLDAADHTATRKMISVE